MRIRTVPVAFWTCYWSCPQVPGGRGFLEETAESRAFRVHQAQTVFFGVQSERARLVNCVLDGVVLVAVSPGVFVRLVTTICHAIPEYVFGGFPAVCVAGEPGVIASHRCQTDGLAQKDLWRFAGLSHAQHPITTEAWLCVLGLPPVQAGVSLPSCC